MRKRSYLAQISVRNKACVVFCRRVGFLASRSVDSTHTRPSNEIQSFYICSLKLFQRTVCYNLNFPWNTKKSARCLSHGFICWLHVAGWSELRLPSCFAARKKQLKWHKTHFREFHLCYHKRHCTRNLCEEEKNKETAVSCEKREESVKYETMIGTAGVWYTGVCVLMHTAAIQNGD